jgi:2-oxoglutarate dehydrogenase E2 component (dihydrolipoamide succinyltransferase)
MSDADLVVPALGESITEAVVSRWLKNVGDPVAADEPLVDLETDKITVQLPSPVAGVLREQRAAQGATVRVGDVVGKVDAGAVAQAAAPAAAKPAAAAPAAAAPASKPAAAPAPVAQAAAPAAPPAPPAPMIATAPAPAARPAEASLDDEALLRLTPAQRRAARQSGHLPEGGGNGHGAGASTAIARPASTPAAPPQPVDPRDEVVAMSPLRKRIAERLVQAQHETASLTTFNEVDMTAVMALRDRFKDTFLERHGVKLGFMSFFAKACVAAAKLWPGVNAEVRETSIIYKKHYDFGIAVSTPKGLVVPVLRGVDTLGFADVEKGILALADKARQGKLTIEDLTGGTFSITNGGIYGSMLSTPLLNYPQTGILGMHNIVKRPLVVGDKVEVRPVMYIALTYDHRVVDGREAVSFLIAVKERLEAPEKLLFEI